MSEAAVRAAGPLRGPVGRRVSAHRSELLKALDRHGVRNARVFGSVARGDDRDDSDVDLLVELPENTGLLTIARIEAELEAILGTTVDLVSAGGLKPAVRSRVEPELIAL
ncbi:MAG: nucleotidyltransferase family protein [Nocardioidaceae bacterium]